MHRMPHVCHLNTSIHEGATNGIHTFYFSNLDADIWYLGFHWIACNNIAHIYKTKFIQERLQMC